MLIYISGFSEALVDVYTSSENVENYIIFFCNYAGIYHSKDSKIYEFWYQAIGYVIIIGMLAIERRMQVWLSHKQGLNEDLIAYFESIDKNAEDS